MADDATLTVRLRGGIPTRWAFATAAEGERARRYARMNGIPVEAGAGGAGNDVLPAFEQFIDALRRARVLVPIATAVPRCANAARTGG
jgi:hypothetical protein